MAMRETNCKGEKGQLLRNCKLNESQFNQEGYSPHALLLTERIPTVVMLPGQAVGTGITGGLAVGR